MPEMPGRMSATEREAAIRKVEAGYADDLREFNVSACERVKGHDNLLPYIALDAIAMPGEEGAVHLREMVEEHGTRGVKLHGPAQGFNMSDERMWPAYSACQETGDTDSRPLGAGQTGDGICRTSCVCGNAGGVPRPEGCHSPHGRWDLGPGSGACRGLFQRLLSTAARSSSGSVGPPTLQVKKSSLNSSGTSAHPVC